MDLKLQISLGQCSHTVELLGRKPGSQEVDSCEIPREVLAPEGAHRHDTHDQVASGAVCGRYRPVR